MLKQWLVREFETKELSKLKYLFEIEVARSKSEIFLSQQKYLHNLLRDTDKLVSKPVSTPIDHNHKLEVIEKDIPKDKKMN